MKITSTMNEQRVVLVLDGRIDAAWSEAVTAALDEAIRSGRPRVELDLSAVTFISSVGIGVLLRASSKLRKVNAALSVTQASSAVREMLRAAKLEALLAVAQPVAAAATESRSFGDGWTGSLFTLEARQSGSVGSLQCIDNGPVQIDASTVAIGHFALATDAASAHGLFGEGLIAGGTLAVAPAHSPRPDCLAITGEHTLTCMARHALVARGAPSFRAVFEGTSQHPVRLSSLAREVRRAIGGSFAMVAVGESAGAFGAWARQSPDEWTKDPAHMNAAELRAALSFSGELMHAGESLTAVVFARSTQEASSEVSDLHAHIAVNAFRPIPRSTSDITAVGALLSEQPLRSVMHALQGREQEESAFLRGSCWIVRLEDTP